jgi:hypothetical protein
LRGDLTQTFADFRRIQGVHDRIKALSKQLLGGVPQHISKSAVGELQGAIRGENGNELACKVDQVGKLRSAELYPRLCIHSLRHEFAASRRAVRPKTAGGTS